MLSSSDGGFVVRYKSGSCGLRRFAVGQWGFGHTDLSHALCFAFLIFASARLRRSRYAFVTSDGSLRCLVMKRRVR